MLLKLDVLASTTIKRKKPWPRLAWLGKDAGDLFLFDFHRLSQIYLPSGKTKKKIPFLQNFVDNARLFGISPSGLFVAGALNSGKVFIWNKLAGTVKLTSVLDKIRNVQGTRDKSLQLHVSDCGTKVLLLCGYHHVFLWETQESSETAGITGDSLRGAWLQIQCGNYLLPDEGNKETAVHGVFFMDPVCGMAATLAWVFNKEDRIHVTSLHLLWSGATYSMEDTVLTGSEKGLALSFMPRWSSFVHPLYNLVPAKRVIKSRKAYVCRVSPDGQVLAVAMNQKLAADTRMMFYSLSRSTVAVVTDLKGCGARVVNSTTRQPSGRSWWIVDMSWTRDSLLLVCITRRGCVAILSKLGEPLEISTSGLSVHMGPGLFLCLHPRIQFKRSSDTLGADSSGSGLSERDPLCQKFSVATHPQLPVILSSDGYLVTVMQLPPAASYPGIMTGLMKDISRLIPDADIDIPPGNLSRVSSVSKISVAPGEAIMSHGVSNEFLSDAPSENNSSGSSSVVPGYGLASGEHGMGTFGLEDAELESTSPEYVPGSAEAILQAQSRSIVALSLGSSCGSNWKNEVGAAMDLTVSTVVKLFQFLLKSADSVLQQLQSSSPTLSRTTSHLSKHQNSGPADLQLHGALAYFRMSLEAFQWDVSHRNVFSRAFHLTHGIVREILLLRKLSSAYKVTTCMQVLKVAERVLEFVYSTVGRDEEQSGKATYSQHEHDAASDVHMEMQGSTRGHRASGAESGFVLDENNEDLIVQASQQTVTQTHLGGSWLLLYNFASDTCKRLYRRRGSSFALEESETRSSSGRKMVDLLCGIQEKLQAIGVRIPSKTSESVNIVGSMPPEDSEDSMFVRKESSLLRSPSQEQTPEAVGRSRTGFREHPFRKKLSTSTPLKSPVVEGLSRKDEDAKTLLSILYLHLQQYDLRAALDLVQSLIEPPVSSEHLVADGNSSFLLNAQSSFISSSRDQSGNELVRVFLQHYPIARVADKRGLEVVHTLARFMAAYFSNLPLYIFPPYQPVALPPFCFEQENTITQQLTEASHVGNRIGLERVQVSKAAREQALDELWSANSTLELMFVSGLVTEGAWLAKNLGDWKNAFLLSFASDMLNTKFPAISLNPQVSPLFPRAPTDTNTQAIAMSRLNPTFKHEVSTLTGEASLDSRRNESEPKKTRQGNGEITRILEGSTNLSLEVSRVLEAGSVAGLDLVPLILTALLDHLRGLVVLFEWTVPEEFYLPYPPSFCPQPRNDNKTAMPPSSVREETLRTEVSAVVQKAFLLLDASNCLAPCVRWYTEKLVRVTEMWYPATRNDPEFPVPGSLVGYADQGFSFEESNKAVGSVSSPQKKGKGIPGNYAGTEGDKPEAKVDDGKLPTSTTSVLQVFRELCALMWLLHVRDKMSKASRKYRQLRSQTMGSDEETMAIHSVCWETLFWTTKLAPFSSLSGVSDKFNDTLLTLLSDMPPSVATANVTATFFNDPDVIQTTSGKAKLKRLMGQYRGVGIKEAGGIDSEDPEEPLSVYFRRKCLEWEEELNERERLFGPVCHQFYQSRGPGAMHKSNANVVVVQSLEVGSISFETDPSYFQFLDTFFMITVSKTVSSHPSKGRPPVPLLCTYRKHLLAADCKSLVALQTKAHSETPARLAKGPSNLFRSHSFTDVRFSRPRPEALPKGASSRADLGADIKRSNSLNDVSRMGTMPGVQILGSSILDMLPALTWLTRWSSEGSTLPSSNYSFSYPSATDTQPVMRVHVPLPLLVNGLWLLQNVYWPWVSDAEVLVDIKVMRNLSTLKKSASGELVDSPKSKPDKTPPSSLRKVLSDSNIQERVKKSAKRNPKKVVEDWASDSERQLRKSQSDLNIANSANSSPSKSLKRNPKNIPDVWESNIHDELRKSQGDSNIAESDGGTVHNPSVIQTRRPGILQKRSVHKGPRFAERFDRLSKSYSDPDIPNIVVQSPTTDEEKDFSSGLNRGYSPRTNAENGRREVDASLKRAAYHSDTELALSSIQGSSARVPFRRKTPNTKRKKSSNVKKEERVKLQEAEAPEVHPKTDAVNQPKPDPEETNRISPFSDIIAVSPGNEITLQSTINGPMRQEKRKKRPPLENEHGTADRTDYLRREFPDTEHRLARHYSRRAHHSPRRVHKSPRESKKDLEQKNIQETGGRKVSYERISPLEHQGYLGNYSQRDPRESPESRDSYEQQRNAHEKVDPKEYRESYRQRGPRESPEFKEEQCQSARVAQGPMELVLVVRPSIGSSPSSLQSDIPLFRIPNTASNTEDLQRTPGVLTPHKAQTVTKAETASQTEHHDLMGSGSQTQRSGPELVPGPVNDHPVGKPVTSGDGENVTRSALTQTELTGAGFHESTAVGQLQLESTPPTHAPTVLTNQQAATNFDPRLFKPPYLPPLLHLPVNKESSTDLDLNKIRLVEVTKKGEGLPLLRMPETESQSGTGLPDLSKIKFLEIPPQSAVWTPLELPQKPPLRPEVNVIKEPRTIPKWPLLRMTGNQSHVNGIDLRNMAFIQNPPAVRAAWPLLEVPRQTEVPKLIPLDKILEFEKGLRRQLVPFGEQSRIQEKENIRPTVKKEERFNRTQDTTVIEDSGRLHTYVETKDERSAPSRQRRRQREQEKQTRPRSTSPRFKTRKNRRRKSLQGKVISVQPPKKTRIPETESDTRKPLARHKNGQPKKSLKTSVSLSESELELTKMSDHVLDVSDEEERYYRVEKSPEPFAFTRFNVHRLGKVRRATGVQEEIAEPSNQPAGKPSLSVTADDFIPGPPSMKRIKERIGRTLDEVDRQRSGDRTNSPNTQIVGMSPPEGQVSVDRTESPGIQTSRTEALDSRRGKQSRSQQKAGGVQVGVQVEPSYPYPMQLIHLPQSSTAKVNTSAQTDRLELGRLEKSNLVASGVQTDGEADHSVSVQPHAPSLPPDIFLNLKMPQPSSFTDSAPHVDIDARGMPGGALSMSTGVDPVAESGALVSSRARQFLSVADINPDQWATIQKTPRDAADDGRMAELEKAVKRDGERRSNDVGVDDLPTTVKPAPRKIEVEDDLDESGEHTIGGPDRITLDMLDSTDTPLQRLFPTPFPATSNSSARAVSTQFLNERMKEMSERIAAMDDITQNMDREFKSSRVLLRAIESIDEVLNPPLSRSSSTDMNSSSEVTTRISRRDPKRWVDNAPWRRGGRASVKEPPSRTPPQTQEEIEDSIDVDLEDAEVNVASEDGGSKMDEAGEDDDKSQKEGSIDVDEAEGMSDLDDGDQGKQSGQDDAKEVKTDLTDLQKKDDPKMDKKTSDQGQEKHTSSLQDPGRNGSIRAGSPLESVTLSPKVPKEIFPDKNVSKIRSRDPSPDAREEVKRWMVKKRSERLADWKNQQEDLRAQEYQPFMSPTQGSSSFKKMKLMEQERDAKRRTKADENKQKRIESASHLISEMLSDPVPKPSLRQPNHRYAGSVITSGTKQVSAKKRTSNERYKKKPRGLPKAKQKLNRRDTTDYSIPRQATGSTEGRSPPGKKYQSSPVEDEFLTRRTFKQHGKPAKPDQQESGFESRIPADIPHFLAENLSNRFDIPATYDPRVKDSEVPEEDFWRSGSPTGAEFVTTTTYRNFNKDRTKRFKERDAFIRRSIETSRRQTPRGDTIRTAAGRGGTYQGSRSAASPFPGGETQSEIDRLLEDISDDGFTLDQSKLEGIESLLEEDEELKELLADVIGVGDSRDQRPSALRTRTIKKESVLAIKPQRSTNKIPAVHRFEMRGKDGKSSAFSQKSKAQSGRRLNSTRNLGNRRNVEPAVNASRVLSPEFDDAVSPWNTGDSLRMSDDVAQLLAEAKEAVGDDFSESSGSVMSNIDWDAVNKIMNDV